MGVQDELGAVAMDAPHSQIEREGGPEKFADEFALAEFLSEQTRQRLERVAIPVRIESVSSRDRTRRRCRRSRRLRGLADGATKSESYRRVATHVEGIVRGLTPSEFELTVSSCK